VAGIRKVADTKRVIRNWI